VSDLIPLPQIFYGVGMMKRVCVFVVLFLSIHNFLLFSICDCLYHLAVVFSYTIVLLSTNMSLPWLLGHIQKYERVSLSFKQC